MIRPLYKVHEPFMDVQDGFGHLGVVMYDDANDSIQCHICGAWVKMLAQHARMAHGVKSEQYRERFSLPLKSGLMAKSTSSKFHKRSMTKDNMERLRGMRLKSRPNKDSTKKAISVRRSRRCFAAKGRLSFKNKNGLCPAQMMARYEVVAKIVGRLPSNLDLKTYDSGMYNAARRSGSVDAWRKANGLAIFPKIKQKVFGDIDVIAALRKFSYSKKVSPSVTTWREGRYSPGVSVIQRAFGSWKNALVSAGLN